MRSKMLAAWALDARVDKEMPKTVPSARAKSASTAGAHLYVENLRRLSRRSRRR
jgi:hypothetical protein